MKQISAVVEKKKKKINKISRETHCLSTKHNLRHLSSRELRQQQDILGSQCRPRESIHVSFQ